MLKTLKCKLYPSKSQALRLEDYREHGRRAFNFFLAQRKDAWEKEQKSITAYDQQKILTQLRHTDSWWASVPYDVCKDAIKRVDKAYQAFFRRCKDPTVKRKGAPRFKNKNRYNGFLIAQPHSCIKDNKIHVAGIKKAIRCRGLQEHHGKIKTLCVVFKAGNWYARIVIDTLTDKPELKPVRSAIGIDLGLHHFMADTNGNTVDCPKHYRKAERLLRVANKAVSRKKKGSRNRKKAIIVLQKKHEHIVNCRNDFLHKLSKQLVSAHQLIVGEKMGIKNMVRSKLAKSILDAGWDKFNFMLAYKAESAGGQYIEVSNYRNSQNCSDCGEYVPKILDDRTHICPKCGLCIDRDVNAAHNILNRYYREKPLLGRSMGCVENCKSGVLYPSTFVEALSPIGAGANASAAN